jgi:hypothetical protein
MTKFFLIARLIGRALAAHFCGEAVRVILESILSGIPPLLAIGVGLVAGVTPVEIAATLWHRRTGFK